MNFWKIGLLAIAVAALFSGCATGPNSSSSSSPTVSGYISTGVQKQY